MIKPIPNGVDTDVFTGKQDTTQLVCEIRERFHVDVTSSFNIVYIGSLNKQKNLSLLLQALQEINTKSPDNNIRVIIAGIGPERERLERFSSDNLKSFQVVFLGIRSDVPVILSLAKIAVLLSDESSEGLSNVVLEAMAVGCPVMVTPEVGVSNIVKEAGAGIVVEGKPESISEGLMRLISNPDKCKEMGLKGKNIIGKKFTWDKVASQMLNVYKEILATY